MASGPFGYGPPRGNQRPFRPGSPYRHQQRSPHPSDGFSPRGRSPGPQQYFTSGNTPHVASPQRPAFHTPRGPGFSTPYRHGGYGPSPAYSPQYTPSPRAHQSPRQRGGWSRGRGRGQPRNDYGGTPPIEAFYSEEMLRDPWANMEPVSVDRPSFTTV